MTSLLTSCSLRLLPVTSAPLACMPPIAWLQISIFLLFVMHSLFPPLLSHPYAPPDHSVSCLLLYSQGSTIFTGINQCHTLLGGLGHLSWVMLWESSLAPCTKHGVNAYVSWDCPVPTGDGIFGVERNKTPWFGAWLTGLIKLVNLLWHCAKEYT